MAPSTAPQLHTYTARRATFNKSRKGANRALNWPHPLTVAASKTSTVHPDHLAQAGFYCTPTAEEPTRSQCFACGTVVEHWNEGDSPIELHLQKNETCGWALMTHLTEIWPDGIRDKKGWDKAWGVNGTLWPQSSRMQSARVASFQAGDWPHEQRSGVPSTSEIAAAGWFFRPGSGTDTDDNCVCPYCTRTVEGWEKGDDPIALHKRKLGLKCPFFVALDPPEALENGVAEVKSAVDQHEIGSKMSRSKGRHQKLAQAEDNDDDAHADEADIHDEEADAADVASVAETEASSTRASRRTTAASRVASSPAPESSAKTTRSTRGSSKKKKQTGAASVAVTPEEDAIVEEVDETVAMDGDEVDEPEPQPTPVPSVEVEVVVDLDAEMSRGSGAAKKGRVTRAKKTTTKATTSKGRGKKVVDAEQEAASEVDHDTEMMEDGLKVLQEQEPVPQDHTAQEDSSIPQAKQKSAALTKKKKASSSSSKKRSTPANATTTTSDNVADSSLLDAAQLAETYLDRDAPMEEIAPEPVPAVVRKSGDKSTSIKSKGKKTSGSDSVAPVSRQPLTPTVATGPSPRVIKSIPSKTNSPVIAPRSAAGSTKSAPVSLATAQEPRSSAASPSAVPLSSLYAPLPNPFISSTTGGELPAPTASELQMTLHDWYDMQGRLVYSQVQSEMTREMKVLEDRVEAGRAELKRMIEAAQRREEATAVRRN